MMGRERRKKALRQLTGGRSRFYSQPSPTGREDRQMLQKRELSSAFLRTGSFAHRKPWASSNVKMGSSADGCGASPNRNVRKTGRCFDAREPHSTSPAEERAKNAHPPYSLFAAIFRTFGRFGRMHPPASTRARGRAQSSGGLTGWHEWGKARTPQSASQAGVSLRLRKRASHPSPAKPVSVIAQVDGSGAATKLIDT